MLVVEPVALAFRENPSAMAARAVSNCDRTVLSRFRETSSLRKLLQSDPWKKHLCPHELPVECALLKAQPTAGMRAIADGLEWVACPPPPAGPCVFGICSMGGLSLG